MPAEQLSDHVWRVPIKTRTLPPNDGTNMYLIGNRQEAVMVDAGYADDAALAGGLAAVRHLGVLRVIALVITHHHQDHFLRAREAAEAFGAPILAHPLAAQRMAGVPVAGVLTEGGRLEAGGAAIAVLDAPGHVDGHLNLWVQPDRVMLAGDNLAGVGTTSIVPPEGSLHAYLKTLRRVLDFDPALVAPGHGPAITNPRQWIEDVIAHRLMREEQITGHLQQGPRTVAQLAEAIYAGTIPPAAMRAARSTVTAHLEKLRDEGRAAANGEHWRLI